jgi:nucleotidyltransferase/DNA polymerase involved in DNA repair
MTRSILYADVPGFYAEVERIANPGLAERPVVVGGDPRKRGLVQAATQDALAAGVVLGMTVIEALERCPRARALRTDMARYRETEKRLRAILVRSAPRLEPAGTAAAYLAAPDAEETLADFAARLRSAVRRELRLPLRVGAGPVKFVARLAAEEAGAEGFLAVAPARVAAFLHPLPVARLPGVGPHTAVRLAELGVRTAGDVVALGRAAIERSLGNHGLAVLAAACGQGDDRIRGAAHPQSISQEITLAEDTLDRALLGEEVRGLSERLARALGVEGLIARRLALKLRYADGERITRSVSVERGVATADEISGVAGDLLGRTQAGTRPVRLLGLAASRLLRPERDDRQLTLFADEG